SPQVHEVFAVTRLDTYLDLRRAGEPTGPAGGLLVVGDDPGIRRVLEAILPRRGFHGWLPARGGQAVELYPRPRAENAPVLLDVQMPEMDGPHTLARLRQQCPAVRCCFMTADPTPYSEEGLLRMGAVRVFRKPFALTEFLDTLNGLAGRPPRCPRERRVDISHNEGV